MSTTARYAQRKPPPGAYWRVAVRLLGVFVACASVSAVIIHGLDCSPEHERAALRFALFGIIPELFAATADALAGWGYVTVALFLPVTVALCNPQSRGARWFAIAAILWWFFFNLAIVTLGV